MNRKGIIGQRRKGNDIEKRKKPKYQTLGTQKIGRIKQIGKGNRVCVRRMNIRDCQKFLFVLSNLVASLSLRTKYVRT
jgi:3-dehydroquinate synthase class II